MTGSRSTAGESVARSATIRTELDDAEVLAASVRPDNTPEIDTRVEEGDDRPGSDDGDGGDGFDGDDDEFDGDRDASVVVTTVERETTGGLRTTVDDYVVNLAVAQEVVQVAKRHASANADDARANQTNADDTDNTQP